MIDVVFPASHLLHRVLELRSVRGRSRGRRPEVETSEQTSRVPGEIIINVNQDGLVKISNEVGA